MSNKPALLTPVGRLVQGSLYEPQTTDLEGRPLVIKHGTNAGQPRVEYYFALAIAKGSEKHWAETEWGKLIWNTGHTGFPQGQASSPSFAWKIQDGDSDIVNKAGRKNCDREGYPGHWVLNFTSGFAPSIVNEDGSKQIVDKDFVNPGDFIQVFGTVSDNGSTQQPGVFLNHSVVAFSRYGHRISLGIDPKSIGFGKSPIPAGALTTPPEGRFNPIAPIAQPAAPIAPAPVNTNAPVVPPVPSSVPSPHTAILNPPATKQRVMTEKAGEFTYEQLIASSWTDEQLIQHGYMLA